jgi:Mg-chelatase subunit ChlD
LNARNKRSIAMSDPNPSPIDQSADSTPADDIGSGDNQSDVRPATHVVVVIDASGSMSPLQEFVVNGANELLTGLEPSVRVTIVKFNGDRPFDVLVDEVPAAEVAPLTGEDYQPRSSTPLHDAVGKAIRAAAGQVNNHEVLTGEPAKVVFAIISDGEENSSTQFDVTQVRRLLEAHQEQGWDVRFIGLGIDAFAEGAQLGVQRHSTRSVAHSEHGTLAAFRNVSRAATGHQDIDDNHSDVEDGR